MESHRELSAYALVHNWNRVVEAAIAVVRDFEDTLAADGPVLHADDLVAALMGLPEMKAAVTARADLRARMNAARLDGRSGAAREAAIAALGWIEMVLLVQAHLPIYVRDAIAEGRDDVADDEAAIRNYVHNVRVAYHIVRSIQDRR